MTVHVGQVTSEVHAASPGGADRSAPDEVNEWDERAHLAAQLDRVARDRLRTSTGYGDD